MSDWSVRPFRPGDEPRVERLYEEVHGRAPDAAHYHWKLFESPVSIDAPTVWLAVSGDRAVGHYAGTPMRFWLEGGTRTVVHACDALTAPDFRRRGIFGTLGRTAHEAWKRAGATFVLGIPTEPWGSRRRYLDFREQFRAFWLWHPLRPSRIVARRLGRLAPVARVLAPLDAAVSRLASLPLRRAARGVSVTPTPTPGPVFDRLWERLRDGHPALVVRDRARVAYRFGAPGRDHRLLLALRDGRPVGYLAWRRSAGGGSSVGWVLDLFTAPDDVAARSALWLATTRDMAAADVRSGRVLVSPGTGLARFYRSAGFLRARGRYDICVAPLDPPDPSPALADPSRWFTTAADYDAV